MEIFYKGIVISGGYSLVAILVSLLLLLVNESFIYGALVGIGTLFLSYLLIWVVIFKIPMNSGANVAMASVVTPIIRIGLFLIVYLTVVLAINGIQTGLDEFLYPVNTFSLLFTYTIPVASYFTIMLIDINQ